jgi:4-hydroxyproline epimerase
VDCPGLGALQVDVAYGGNFYAIVEPQERYGGLDTMRAADILRLSPHLRARINERYTFEHPDHPTIRGLSHVQWTGPARNPKANGRNAVFYGEKAIDRSPCGTGTSARMAQLAARGALRQGDTFIHESYIGSLFTGRVEETTRVGPYEAIIPSIEGWAVVTGFNTIFINDDDPYRHGFQVL